ncbi:MAG: membrane protein insertase YidC [Proteobacteria bacterium]|nr:membrane protein insertase YidC [Pseudomonadota bacterium]
MNYLSYNGQGGGDGGSGRWAIMMGLLLLAVLALEYFLPKQPADQTPQGQTEQVQAPGDAAQAVPVSVLYQIEPRTLSTDSYDLTLTNAGGGRISSFHLKKPDRYFEHGDYIRSQKPEVDSKGGILPLEVTFPAFGIGPETQFKTVSDAGDSKQARFLYTDVNGNYEFEKIFAVTDDPYVVHVKFRLTNRSSQALADNMAISMYIKQIEGEEPGLFTPGSYVAAKCHSGGAMKYLDATDKDKEKTFDSKLNWFAVDESYFAIAMTADHGMSCEISNNKDGLLRSRLNTAVTIHPNETLTYSYDIFMGPKEARYLSFGEPQDKNLQLDSIIDYGFMEVLAKPMAWILDKFHEWTGNWGLAIIILTLIVRILLWPIAQKSQVSMSRMSKIAPLMQEIQEKYKDDPATMQQKQIELYQKYKISPFGCLPLLIQMPIFFALYRCIFVTGGLYRAPFFGWIQDLSARDPYFILPIISVLLLLGQQLLMPSTTKNKQQKIMMFAMPIIFGLMMLWLPSGLCLYMVISSLFSIVQSYYVRRMIAREEDIVPADGSSDAADVIDVENLSSKDKRAAKRREESQKT